MSIGKSWNEQSNLKMSISLIYIKFFVLCIQSSTTNQQKHDSCLLFYTVKSAGQNQWFGSYHCNFSHLGPKTSLRLRSARCLTRGLASTYLSYTLTVPHTIKSPGREKSPPPNYSDQLLKNEMTFYSAYRPLWYIQCLYVNVSRLNRKKVFLTPCLPTMLETKFLAFKLQVNTKMNTTKLSHQYLFIFKGSYYHGNKNK